MIERRITNTRINKDGKIVAVCNPSEWWSPRDVFEVINDIEQSFYVYYIQTEEQKLELKVANGTSEKYLRTNSKLVADNLLEKLPHC